MTSHLFTIQSLVMAAPEVMLAVNTLLISYQSFIAFSGGFGEGAGTRALPLDPNSFVFMQFWGKIWPNNRLLPWRPLGNPGSATGIIIIQGLVPLSLLKQNDQPTITLT